MITSVLKGLGFLNETGEPTQRYYDFLDQTQSKKVLAIGIQEAYEDLFDLRRDAQNMPQDEVKNKLKTLTQGQKVIDSMARTFKTLCDYADWSEPESLVQEIKGENINENTSEPVKTSSENVTSFMQTKQNGLGLCYNIQIHLPETTNMAVYEAIFQSIKKHLM